MGRSAHSPGYRRAWGSAWNTAVAHGVFPQTVFKGLAEILRGLLVHASNSLFACKAQGGALGLVQKSCDLGCAPIACSGPWGEQGDHLWGRLQVPSALLPGGEEPLGREVELGLSS